MNNVKSFEEFVNEDWFNGPESYYRLQKLYRDDPSFRRSVDNGTLRTEVGAEERITPNDDEEFYGLFNISKNWNPNNEDVQVSMHCLTDNPKDLYGSVKSKEIMDILDIFAEKVGEKDYEYAWVGGSSIYAKVSVKKRPSGINKATISHIIKVYKDRYECEQDMIESLKKN